MKRIKRLVARLELPLVSREVKSLPIGQQEQLVVTQEVSHPYAFDDSLNGGYSRSRGGPEQQLGR